MATKENNRLKMTVPDTAMRVDDDLFICERQLNAILNTLSRDCPTIDWRSSFDVSEEFSNAHRYGDGGEIEHRTVLLKDHRPLLLSVEFASYETTLDDTDDYRSIYRRATFILSDDPVTQRILAEARRSSTPNPSLSC